MPTLRAVALVISLFSVHIGNGNLQNASGNNEAKDLVALASTPKNETKKEDKLAKILPLVTFDCTGRTEGYYADVQFDCEAFHYCKTSGERFTFVCPPKSRFNQKHMICDYDRYGLKMCHNAEKYFNLNENLYPKTEDEKKPNKKLPTVTTKSKEKAKLPSVKKESSVKEEKPFQPKSNKTKKLEKTYIVTEYYEHDIPTTEQPLIDDASPKIYKWYTPPVTSDSPLDEVEYDDSIQHHYEYPDDYPDNEPYYDRSEEHPKSKPGVSNDYGKDKKYYQGDGYDEKKPKKDKSNMKIPPENNSHDRSKQHYLDHDSKQLRSHSSSPDAHYEDRNSKEATYSDLHRGENEPQTEIRSKSYQEDSKERNEPSINDENRDGHGYSAPLEETQKYEEDKELKNARDFNPTSEEQKEENTNYYQQPQLTEESDPTINYQEDSKDNQNQNHAANSEEAYEPQPPAIEDVRSEEEVREYIRNNEGKITRLSEPQHREIANTGNSHNRKKSRYRAPSYKVSKYEIIVDKPEEQTDPQDKQGSSGERKSKPPLPQSKTKTTSFYHRYTSKTEQPTHITVYEELPQEEPPAETAYNQSPVEPKDARNYREEGNLQKDNSDESVDKQKTSQPIYTTVYRERLPQEQVTFYNQRPIEQKEVPNYNKDNPQTENSREAIHKHTNTQSTYPIHTTVYREELPAARAPHNQKLAELTNQRHYQEENPQRSNSDEAIDKERTRQLHYPTVYQEETSQEGSEASGQEGSYEEKPRKLNNQHVNPGQIKQPIIPQRNPGIYIQQPRKQHMQIPVEIAPQLTTQHMREVNEKPYQNNFPQEIITNGRIVQLRPEIPTYTVPSQQRPIQNQAVLNSGEEINNGRIVQLRPKIPKETDRFQQRPVQNQAVLNSGEIINNGRFVQPRPEIPTETVRIQQRPIQNQAVHYKKPPEANHHLQSHHYATNGEGHKTQTVDPRLYYSQNNQRPIQYYSTKESKKPINSYQLNRNLGIGRNPSIRPELTVFQHKQQPVHQQNYKQNIRKKYTPSSRHVHHQQRPLNVNIHKPHSKFPNEQRQSSYLASHPSIEQVKLKQQQRRPSFLVTPPPMEQVHQPHYVATQKYLQQHLLQGTPFSHQRNPEQPRIHTTLRRQKRQATNGLPLSNQFKALLNRLYAPVGSPSSNYLNNFQDFITSSISSSENSRNPSQQRPDNYFPQQHLYNPRYSIPYNSNAQIPYNRSPTYSDHPYPQSTFYQRPPGQPYHFRYFDDNGEHLNPINVNLPERPSGDSSSPKPETDSQTDDTSSQPHAPEEQTAPQPIDSSRNSKPTYPPLPTVNPQNFPELKDFPFFNPSFPYSQQGNDSKNADDNSQFSYNRIPAPRYPIPDLGAYFDPYGEFGVTPLYESLQVNSNGTKDSDSTESPANKEEEEENKKDSSRHRIPGRVRRPLNTVLNPPYEEKNHRDKPREQTSLFVTAPLETPVSTFDPRSVHLFVTPPPFLAGHSRAPSVFGPEFFVPPLKSPYTTESTSKEAKDSSEEHATQKVDSLETSTEGTTPAPRTQITSPAQRQHNRRRRPQGTRATTARPTQGTRGTTRRPSLSRSSSRYQHTSEIGSSVQASESGKKPTPSDQESSKPTTRRPTPTKPSSRAPARERPKPATLPPVRPTQKPASESDFSEEAEPNPFRGSVPYGTRLRRPPPSRQTSSTLSHEAPRASTSKRGTQSSASDRSITIARTEQEQGTRHVQSVERSHQPRRAINYFRERTPPPSSSTTHQTPTKNIFSYSNEEGVTTGYSSNESKEEQRTRRPNVRRASYINKNQNSKPEAKPKLLRGRTRVRSYHPRRAYAEASTQSPASTTTAITTSTTSTTTPSTVNPLVQTTTTPETTTVATQSPPKQRVYTSRHGGSLRNQRVINRLKDKPRLFTFGRPRGTVADDSNNDNANSAT